MFDVSLLHLLPRLKRVEDVVQGPSFLLLEGYREDGRQKDK